jgi:hypothetical protein
MEMNSERINRASDRRGAIEMQKRARNGRFEDEFGDCAEERRDVFPSHAPTNGSTPLHTDK